MRVPTDFALSHHIDRYRMQNNVLIEPVSLVHVAENPRGPLKYDVVTCKQAWPRISQLHRKQAFSPGAKVHPKCLFHTLSHFSQFSPPKWVMQPNKT